MASVILVSKAGVEFSVTTVRGFVNQVYSRGALPKTGTVEANYNYLLTNQRPPFEGANEAVTLHDLQTPGTPARTAVESAAPATPDASTTTKGKLRLATTAEAAAGTSTSLALSPAAGKAALGSADPVLSEFAYDSLGNLTSYKEDGILIVLTYNADGTVATSKRGDSAAKAFSYSGGNLVGVA